MSDTISVAAMGVALATALWSAWYAHHSAAKRELRNWRRQELLRAVSELAQLSSHRQAVLAWALDTALPPQVFGESIDPFNTAATGGPHPRHSVDQMNIIVERVRLLDQPLAEVAQRIAELHRETLEDADIEYATSGDHVSHLDAMVVDSTELKALHAQLTDAFQRAVRLRKYR